MFDQVIVPAGLQVQLSRHRVLDGMSDEADRWMQLLNERREECIATLKRDGLAIEVIFRRQEGGEDFLYWFELRGADSPGDIAAVPEAERRPIDIDHIEFTHRAKERGYTDVPPQLVLMPPTVEAAVRGWLGSP